MSEIPWREFKLALGESAVWRPLCSEAGCTAPAVRIIGRYENSDSMQGEHSKFGGWYFCQEHAVQFVERISQQQP